MIRECLRVRILDAVLRTQGNAITGELIAGSVTALATIAIALFTWALWRSSENSVPARQISGRADTEQNLASAVERYLARYFSGFDNALPPPGLYHRVLREVEYPLLSAALAATRGNQIRAADLLGVNRNTLRKKIRDLDVRVIRSSG